MTPSEPEAPQLADAPVEEPPPTHDPTPVPTSDGLDQSSSQAHIASVDAAPASQRSRVWIGAFVLACLATGGAAAFLALGGDKTPVRASETSSSAPPPIDEPAPSPAPTAAPATSSPPDAIGACAATLLPSDTFATPPDLGSFCKQRNPIEGARSLQNAVVSGGNGRGVTAGMKEIATMGWYRIAAFAVVRGYCCEAPVALQTPTNIPCNVDNRLERLGREVSHGGDRASETALQQVTQSFYCIAHGGGARQFHQESVPNGGELTAFLRLFARARRAAVKHHGAH